MNNNLELMRQSIFDKEDEVNRSVADIKRIREERFALVQKLREECPHKEITHCKGYVRKEIKLAEIDMPGHFTYEEVEVISPRRKCTFCGLDEIGKHVLDHYALRERHKDLPVGQSVDIDREYMFDKLGNKEKRRVVDFKGQHIKCPGDYI